jgi:hypothetical protein
MVISHHIDKGFSILAQSSGFSDGFPSILINKLKG